MKKILLVLLWCLTVAALMNNAEATVIDFDDLGVIEFLDSQYSAVGVTFSNSDGYLYADHIYVGPPFSEPNNIWPENFFGVNKNRADFSLSGVRSVSVDMGDWNVDEDLLYLEAYDSSDNLLASATEVLPWDLEGGKTISVNSTLDIRYVKFWGEGFAQQNSVVFDNFRYTAVPEPTAMLLFGLGGVSFGLFRRLRGKR